MKAPVTILILYLLIASIVLHAEQRDALTPKPSSVPRINGSEIFGVRPGHPFLYRISATGDRPITFFSKKLAKGLHLDSRTGIVTGKIERRGNYPVALGARNNLGSATKRFQIVVGDQLALTPPMGWDTWYSSYLKISDSMLRAEANAMIASGLADHGYSYIDIDDGWNIKPQVKASDETPRDASGNLKPGKLFPDMKGLADYVHEKGLKMGIYISPGPQTCDGFEGSYQHERQDAEQFARWGIDLLKYDLCSSYMDKFLSGPNDPNVKKPYQIMGSALQSVDRDILFYMCQYGYADVWQWGREVGGHEWRTTGDLGGAGRGSLWNSVTLIGFGQAGKEKWAGPGGWNDPDNMELGRIMWDDKQEPTPLTHNEQFTHFTLWSLLAAPLVIGGDLTQMDDFTLRLLGNDEVIAVDQDILGKQGAPVYRSGSIEVWAKQLKGGTLAVGLFNRGESETDVTARWSDLGIQGKRLVRDLWRQKDLGEFRDEFHLSVGEHGVELVLLRPSIK
jgi:alpha-galactosidase